MTFSQLMVGIFALSLIFLVNEAEKLLKKYFTSLSNKIENDNFKDIVGLVDTSVIEMVDYLRVNVVAEMKEMAADGKLTKEEADQLKTTVRNHVARTLNNDSLKVLSKVVGNIDTWLDAKIEKAVIDTKK